MSPSCPRCGYDLSGQTAAWSTSCPLGGTCSECGLELACRDVLNPDYVQQALFFEHAERFRGRALRVTLLRSVNPYRFWGWIKLHNPANPTRMLATAALGMLLAYAASIGLVLLFITFNALFRAVPRGPGVSWFRAVSYKYDADLFWPLGTWWNMGPTRAYRFIRPLELLALLIPLCMPLAFAALPETLRRARIRRMHLVRIAAYSMILLPFLMYVPAFVGVVLSEIAHRTGSWSLAFHSVRLLEKFGHLFRLAAMTIWVLLWWAMALRRYLRLPHALGVVIAAWLMALLAVSLAMILIAGTWFTYDIV